MSKPIPRSRLNITYRTTIDGVVTQKRLPMRVLVLGDFTGGSKTPYEKRRIFSIPQGTPVSSYMRELALACPIDDPDLQSVIAGRMTAKITGSVKRPLEEEGRFLIRYTGEGVIESDAKSNGLCTSHGTVLLAGYGEATKDKSNLKLDPATLHVQGNVDGDASGIVDFKLTHTFPTPDFDEDALSFEITTHVPINLTIPIRTMNAFTPQHVAQSVPEIHRLVVLRRLLGELRNSIASRPDLREGMKVGLKHEELEQLRAWMIANFPKLQLPPEVLSMVQSRSKALAAAA
jgi:predicted component of type VI protein secretion system